MDAHGEPHAVPFTAPERHLRMYRRSNSMSDNATWEDLCRRLKASDSDAFERIFRTIREDLLRFVHSIVQDAPQAHDLVQDVFVALWDLRETLDPRLSLRAYLFRMARNRAYRHLRDERLHARKRQEMHIEAGPATVARSPVETFDAASFERRLRHWIDELPERQREALILTRFHELTHQQVAAVMNISPRTVNNHVMRALDAIRIRVNGYQSIAKQDEPTKAHEPQR